MSGQLRKAFLTFVLGIVGGVVFAAGDADAQKSFSVPVEAVSLSGGATVAGTVNLGNSGSPGFLFPFVLPEDYAANQTVEITFYLSAATPSCAVRFVPFHLSRLRIGSAIAIGTSGLTAVGGATVDLSDVGIVVGKRLLLRRASTVLPGQRPRDLIRIGMQRQADDGSDTCTGVLFVHGIDIRYPTADQ